MSRENRWNNIWNRKSCDNGDKIPLHHVNGFTQLTTLEYSNLVTTMLKPINIKKNWSIFDCGCGAGAFLEQINLQYGCNNLSGIDYSSGLVEIARALHGNIQIGTITDLSEWPDETFDCVVCFSVYFYLETPDAARQALREAIRICKTGGTVYIGDVNDFSKKEAALEMRKKTHENQCKLSTDSPDHMYLEKSLFTDIASEYRMKNIEIVDHCDTDLIDYYDTANYRFSVYMEK